MGEKNTEAKAPQGLEASAVGALVMRDLEITVQPERDTVTINGTIYAGALFREFGCNLKSNIGKTLKIIGKDDGVVTVETVTVPTDESGVPLY